jgi:pimeloyl-ACP methyl ester carboxylesterase
VDKRALKPQYSEQPVLLPDGKIGIVTRPIGGEQRDGTAVLILNTGIIHRVGHNRMYVTLGRQLAEGGLTVLRFDLSGIGDSERRQGELTPLEAALADIRDAVDWLEKNSDTHRVVLVGICSGANLALLYGGRDERVVGVTIVDPSIPPTIKYYIREFLRYGSRRAYWGVVRRRRIVAAAAWRARGNEAASGEVVHTRLGEKKTKRFIEDAYQLAVQRGLKLLMVLTDGQPRQHNYRRQVFDAFPRVKFGNLLALEYFTEVDHLFSDEMHRDRLFRRIENWLNDCGFARAAELEWVGVHECRMRQPIAPLTASK